MARSSHQSNRAFRHSFPSLVRLRADAPRFTARNAFAWKQCSHRRIAMIREMTAAPADPFVVPLFVLQRRESGWVIQLAIWNLMAAPFCPPRHDHPCADGQLAIPERIAEDDEHGLFA
jgi:hypothetical protein